MEPAEPDAEAEAEASEDAPEPEAPADPDPEPEPEPEEAAGEAPPEEDAERPPTPELDAYQKRIAEIDARVRARAGPNLSHEPSVKPNVPKKGAFFSRRFSVAISPRSAGSLTPGPTPPHRTHCSGPSPPTTQAASRLERLDAAETHLDTAEAEAAAAELRALEVADAMYTVRHRLTGAPRAAPDVRLDASLVSEHDLIDAKTLMATNESKLAARLTRGSVPPPRMKDPENPETRMERDVLAGTRHCDDVETSLDHFTEPSYAASTKTSLNRAVARAERLTETVPPFRKSDTGDLMSEEEYLAKTLAARLIAAERAR